MCIRDRVYLLFLVILGLPIIVCEFSVGRASQKSIATSYNALEPPHTRWHYARWAAIAGNYLLVMFYSCLLYTSVPLTLFYPTVKL